MKLFIFVLFVQGHVPEPFSMNDLGDHLKEGMSGGLGGQQRWNMSDRTNVK